jgi:TfoX/Sxy family transcriptional regulator of competence genes
VKWQKSPQELVDLFAGVVPGPPAAERKMFGYPAGFVNGNMFMGLFQDEMILRLPEEQRKKLIQKHGAKPFEPMPGRPMKEYVSLPRAVLKDRKELGTWVAKALEYGTSLKPKSKTKKPVRIVRKGPAPGVRK